jgi:hypothetical protein
MRKEKADNATDQSGDPLVDRARELVAELSGLDAKSLKSRRRISTIRGCLKEFDQIYRTINGAGLSVPVPDMPQAYSDDDVSPEMKKVAGLVGVNWSKCNRDGVEEWEVSADQWRTHQPFKDGNPAVMMETAGEVEAFILGYAIPVYNELRRMLIPR